MVCNEGAFSFWHLKLLEMLADIPDREIKIIVQNELDDVHALQFAFHHEQIFFGFDTVLSVILKDGRERLKDLQDIAKDCFYVFFLLPKAEVEGLPDKVEDLIEILIFQHLGRINGSILLQFLLETVQDSLEGWVPRLSIRGSAHYINSFIFKLIVVRNALPFFNWIEFLAFCIKIVQKTDDGHFSFMQLIFFEEI